MSYALKFNRISWKKVIIRLLLFVFILVMIGIILVGTLYVVGKQSLNSPEHMVISGKNIEGGELNQAVWYKGQEYAYKKGVYNILLLGIDNYRSLKETVLPGDLGQSDAIYLLSVDTDQQKLNVVGVPRDSMVSIEIRSPQNEYSNVKTLQITLQYAYGDTCEHGSQLAADAVSRLLYDVPIDRVCVINLNAIATINDAIGGVTMEIEEDVTNANGVVDEALTKGNIVTVDGWQAQEFLQKRDTTSFASCLARLGRQEQYLDAFVPAVKAAIKRDILLPFKLYHQTIDKGYVYTDASIPELTYLTIESMKTSFEIAHMETVAGTLQKGRKYEEYYVDYPQLQQQIIDCFYITLQ